MTYERTPYLTCALLGLAGLFAGVTGPLLSAYVPVLAAQALGTHRFAIGAVMALDNVLLLLMVPWAGARSDRAQVMGQGRLSLGISGLLLASAGMATLPFSLRWGLSGLLIALVLLYTGINVQRAPLQALIADLVPPRHRPLATASSTFQMCVAAVAFLMLAQIIGMTLAFLVAAATVIAIALLLRSLLPPSPVATDVTAPQSTPSSARDVLRAIRPALAPGLRSLFIASLLLQLVFQTFTTWFALHAGERFTIPPAQAGLGFVAWALGGVVGAVPAGALGVWLGRRRAMLLGFGLMAACALALHRATNLTSMLPLLALMSAAWTLPTVSAYPLFIERMDAGRRGAVTSVFLLCMALGGFVGDPLNGAIFDSLSSYRGLFVLMGLYSSAAFLAVLAIRPGYGEADVDAASPSLALDLDAS